MLLALYVQDRALYTQYRKAIEPLLKEYQGSFPYDTSVEEMIDTPLEEKRINHVCTLRFDNEEFKDAFFNDSRYLKIKNNIYDNAIKMEYIISTYRI